MRALGQAVELEQFIYCNKTVERLYFSLLEMLEFVVQRHIDDDEITHIVMMVLHGKLCSQATMPYPSLCSVHTHLA